MLHAEDCLRRAEDCARLAEAAVTSALAARYRHLERSWLYLVRLKLRTARDHIDRTAIGAARRAFQQRST